MLAIDHTNDQRHWLILFAVALWAEIQRQHQRLLVQLPLGGRHPPAGHPLQQRGEAACHVQFLTWSPGIYAVRIVIPQFPQQAPHRVRIAGPPGAMRQGQGHRILTAVQGQQRAFVIQCGRSMHGHTRVLECCRRPSAYPAGHASVQRPSHHLGPGLRHNPSPRRRSQSRTDVRFIISLCYCAEYPCQVGVPRSRPKHSRRPAAWSTVGAAGRISPYEPCSAHAARL